VVLGAGRGDLRLRGTFRIGDTGAFVRAVAALHGLVVREQGGQVELGRGK
jgi:ferric-dicitrate binding protein FerR (iron transport regulator)